MSVVFQLSSRTEPARACRAAAQVLPAAPATAPRPCPAKEGSSTGQMVPASLPVLLLGRNVLGYTLRMESVLLSAFPRRPPLGCIPAQFVLFSQHCHRGYLQPSAWHTIWADLLLTLPPEEEAEYRQAPRHSTQNKAITSKREELPLFGSDAVWQGQQDHAAWKEPEKW